MESTFPGAVPEIPVTDIKAAAYYERNGFGTSERAKNA